MSPRVPPHSLEAEAAILGSVLLVNEAMDEALAILRDDDFYDPRNGLVFATMRRIHAHRRAIDHVSLRDALVADGKLSEAGGDEHLLSLTASIPNSDRVETYAKIVHDYGQRRRLLRVCLEQGARGYDTTIEPSVYVAETESRVFEATQAHRSEGGLEHVDRALSDLFEDIQHLSKLDSEVTGLPLGLTDVDRMMTGLHPGELIIVGGRPGMGKSAFAGLGAMSSARRGDPAAIFSLEMPRKQFAARMLAAQSSVDVQLFRSARIAGDQWSRISRGINTLSGLPIYIDDTPGVTIPMIRTRCRKLKAKHGKLGVIVVDYIQLCRGTQKGGTRESEIAEVSRGLKELSKELDCPVIGLVQLNREVEKRPDKRPQLSDIRESGSIEQDADAVLFLLRPWYYRAMAAKENGGSIPFDDGIAEVIIAKQRNGPQGSVTVRFVSGTTEFTDA